MAPIVPRASSSSASACSAGAPTARQGRKKKRRREPAPAEQPEQPKRQPEERGKPLDSLLRPSLLSLSLSCWPPLSGREILCSVEPGSRASKFVAWMLAPLEPARFEREVRERAPLHLSRAKDRSYFRGWFGSAELKALLIDKKLLYTEEVDVTSYDGERRTTLNGEGVAPAEEVLGHFERGCSVRLSWPQRHSEHVWALLAALEEYFECGAGCNIYYTPAGSQGFAPHYDDVDVFIMQIEGEKQWTLHPPRSEEEVLPRVSSHDFEPESLGTPFKVINLCPGDLLYLPRGTVHQAFTPAGEGASLHMTVSISRRHTWRDLLELGLLGALDAAADANLALRRSLPRGHLSYMGAVHSDSTDPRRQEFSNELNSMIQHILATLPMDAVVDQFAVRNWMHERMPPLPPREDDGVLAQDGVGLDEKVRLRSRSVARLAIEGDLAVLYHHAANTRIYRELEEAQHIDFDLEAAPALEHLLTSFPKYVTVKRLPMDTDAQRLDVVAALAQAGLLLVRRKEM